MILATTAAADVPATASYQIGDAASTLGPFSAFTVTPSCTGLNSFTYSATLDTGAALPSFITFDGSTRELTIYSTDPSDADIYTIDVKGTLPSPFNTEETAAQMVLTVTYVPPPAPPPTPSPNTAPYFTKDLEDQEVEGGKDLIYWLPPMVDDEGDSIVAFTSLESGEPLPAFAQF